MKEYACIGYIRRRNWECAYLWMTPNWVDEKFFNSGLIQDVKRPEMKNIGEAIEFMMNLDFNLVAVDSYMEGKFIVEKYHFQKNS